MVFGLGSRLRMDGAPAIGGGRRAFFALSLWSCMAVVLGLLLTVGGCGGGGGSTDTGNTGPVNQNVTIRGRVIENNTSTPVAGATVAAGGVTTATDGAGNFVIETAPAAQTNLTVIGPNYPNGQAAYYDFGYVGSTLYTLTPGNGYPISQTAAGQTVNVGDVRIFSRDLPPPPPAL